MSLLSERQESILKIALCAKYQAMYSDIDTLCRACGFDEQDAKEVKGWKYHGRDAALYKLVLIYEYIKDNERERFEKSLYIYNKNRGI